MAHRAQGLHTKRMKWLLLFTPLVAGTFQEGLSPGSSNHWKDVHGIAEAFDNISPDNLAFVEEGLQSTWDFVVPQELADNAVEYEVTEPNWGHTLGYRCSNLTSLASQHHREKGTWARLVDYLASKDADGSDRVGKYPRVAACMLTTPIAPLSGSKDSPINDKLISIIRSLCDLKGILFEPSSDLEKDFLMDLYGFLRRINPEKAECVLMRFGFLPKLEAQLENLDTALDLINLFTCPEDILASPSPIDSLKFISSFDMGTNKFLIDLLAGALTADDRHLVEFILDKWTTQVVFGLEGKKGHPKLMKYVKSLPMAELLFEKGLTRDLSQIEAAVESDFVEFLKSLPYNWWETPLYDGLVGRAFQHGSRRVLLFFNNPEYYNAEPDDSDVQQCMKSGNVKGLDLILSIKPTLFPYSFDIDAAIEEGHLNILEYLFRKIMTRYHAALPEASVVDLQKKADLAIHTVTNDFEMFSYGHVHMLEWAKTITDEYQIPFPEPTLRQIENALEPGKSSGLLWYIRTFNRPLSLLPDAIGRYTVNGEVYRLFDESKIPMELRPEDLERALNEPDLETLKYFSEKYPGSVRVEPRHLCAAIDQGRFEIFSWASSLLPKLDGRLTCENFDSNLSDQHLKTYQLAHARYGWLPSDIDIAVCGPLYQFGVLKWAFQATNGRMYPLKELIDFFVYVEAPLTLRFLHSLKPLDFENHKLAFIWAAKKGKENIIKWFPQLKELLETESWKEAAAIMDF